MENPGFPVDDPPKEEADLDEFIEDEEEEDEDFDDDDEEDEDEDE